MHFSYVESNILQPDFRLWLLLTTYQPSFRQATAAAFAAPQPPAQRRASAVQGSVAQWPSRPHLDPPAGGSVILRGAVTVKPRDAAAGARKTQKHGHTRNHIHTRDHARALACARACYGAHDDE